MAAWMVDMMREALELLSASADDQLAFLTRQDLHVDDLALTFEDAWVPMQPLIDSFGLGEATKDALAAVDRQLAEMARRGTDWDEAALTRSADWARLRELAHAALDGLPAA